MFSLFLNYSLFLSTSVQAGVFDFCMKHASNQIEMNTCASEEYSRQDAELNMLYQLLKTNLASTDFSSLRQKQREWITQRDASCPSERGSAALMKQNTCLASETKKRNDFFREKLMGRSIKKTKEKCCTIHAGQKIQYGNVFASGGWNPSATPAYQCSFWIREGDYSAWQAVQDDYRVCTGNPKLTVGCSAGRGQVDCF